MNTIVIDTGVKEIEIKRDGKVVGTISFNPQDVSFVERFQSLYGELKSKFTEYEKRAKEIDKITAIDKDGIPENAIERLAYMREVCEYMRSKIDNLFGVDTSQKVFGDALNMEVFTQFLNGITPYISKERAEKTEKYTTSSSIKRRKHKA